MHKTCFLICFGLYTPQNLALGEGEKDGNEKKGSQGENHIQKRKEWWVGMSKIQTLHCYGSFYHHWQFQFFLINCFVYDVFGHVAPFVWRWKTEVILNSWLAPGQSCFGYALANKTITVPTCWTYLRWNPTGEHRIVTSTAGGVLADIWRT